MRDRQLLDCGPCGLLRPDLQDLVAGELRPAISFTARRPSLPCTVAPIFSLRSKKHMGWPNASRVVAARTVVADIETPGGIAVRENPRNSVSVSPVELTIATAKLSAAPEPASIPGKFVDLLPEALRHRRCGRSSYALSRTEAATALSRTHLRHEGAFAMGTSQFREPPEYPFH